MEFITLGYYICEIVDTPEWLGDISQSMLSVTGCFGDVNPDLNYCFFLNNLKKQRKNYRGKYQLNEQNIKQLEEDIGRLFEKDLAIDGRFRELEDANHFYNTYFSRSDCLIVSLSTTEEYWKILQKELTENSDSVADFINGEKDRTKLLGFDILGWDIAHFYTFLDNALQKELQDTKFNQYGLLENSFDEVCDFAKRIQGKGEPVVWIPCRIGLCQ